MTKHDSAARGFFAGDAVRVFCKIGQPRNAHLIDDDLRLGTVAMPHGYAQDRRFPLSVVIEKPWHQLQQSHAHQRRQLWADGLQSWLSAVLVTVERT